jgi:NADH:ubiquinone oxidoreductase subunit 6 (subunit J)
VSQAPDTPDAPDDAPAPAARAAPKPQEPTTWQGLKTDFKWATPLIFFAVIGMAGLLYGTWQVAPPGEENLANVTDTIFASGNHSLAAASGPPVAGRETTNLLVGFEILSALLLAALIAGVVIALRERGDD